jgi:ribosomal protein L29
MELTTMKDIQAMSDKELASFVEKARAEAQKHRFGLGGRDVKAARAARTNVARALTEVTSRSKTTTA